MTLLSTRINLWNQHPTYGLIGPRTLSQAYRPPQCCVARQRHQRRGTRSRAAGGGAVASRRMDGFLGTLLIQILESHFWNVCVQIPNVNEKSLRIGWGKDMSRVLIGHCEDFGEEDVWDFKHNTMFNEWYVDNFVDSKMGKFNVPSFFRNNGDVEFTLRMGWTSQFNTVIPWDWNRFLWGFQAYQVFQALKDDFWGSLVHMLHDQFWGCLKAPTDQPGSLPECWSLPMLEDW